jgi:predicted RNA-binding protein with PUA-like domain
MPAARKYWLFKSEPTHYSIDDLKNDKTAYWDGVRNYQARNMLRDDVKVGDQVLFYHSNAEPMAIVGTMKVIAQAYTDHTAFDKNDECHYDPKSKPENPTWVMVDVEHQQAFAKPVTRDMLRNNPITAKMMVMAKGSRLSIQPVTAEEWQTVHELAGVKPKK